MKRFLRALALVGVLILPAVWASSAHAVTDIPPSLEVVTEGMLRDAENYANSTKPLRTVSDVMARYAVTQDEAVAMIAKTNLALRNKGIPKSAAANAAGGILVGTAVGYGLEGLGRWAFGDQWNPSPFGPNGYTEPSYVDPNNGDKYYYVKGGSVALDFKKWVKEGEWGDPAPFGDWSVVRPDPNWGTGPAIGYSGTADQQFMGQVFIATNFGLFPVALYSGVTKTFSPDHQHSSVYASKMKCLACGQEWSGLNFQYTQHWYTSQSYPSTGSVSFSANQGSSVEASMAAHFRLLKVSYDETSTVPTPTVASVGVSPAKSPSYPFKVAGSVTAGTLIKDVGALTTVPNVVPPQITVPVGPDASQDTSSSWLQLPDRSGDITATPGGTWLEQWLSGIWGDVAAFTQNLFQISDGVQQERITAVTAQVHDMAVHRLPFGIVAVGFDGASFGPSGASCGSESVSWSFATIPTYLADQWTHGDRGVVTVEPMSWLDGSAYGMGQSTGPFGNLRPWFSAAVWLGLALLLNRLFRPQVVV